MITALIEKSSKTVVELWRAEQPRIRIPDTGDVVFAPVVNTDIGDDHRYVQVTVVDPTFDLNTQVRTGPTYVVANDFSIVETFAVRAMTPPELDACQDVRDTSDLQGAGKDMALVVMELVTWLVANTAMQTSDFTPSVRQAYQDLKTIADRVKS